jgi:F0F1-type ATP synthase alpha subunit
MVSLVIYAVNNGFVDAVPVNTIVEWEKGMHAYMSSFKKDLVDALHTDWSEDLENSLKEALTSYGETYKHSS